jgi:hypothetical protein
MALAALGCGLAGTLQLVLAARHLATWWPLAVFLGLAGATQLMLCVRLQAGAGVRLVQLGAAVATAVSAGYVITHTTGMPFGPALHQPTSAHAHTDTPVLGGVGNGHPLFPDGLPPRAEHVSALDLTGLVAELSVLVLLVSVLPARHRRPATNLVLAVGVLLWVVRWLGPLS